MTMDVRVLPVDPERVPYRMDVTFDGQTYSLGLHYNSTGDFYTADMSRRGQVLCVGAKLTYGIPLFRPFADSRYPRSKIIPYDKSGQSTRVGKHEFGKSVLLYVVSADES